MRICWGLESACFLVAVLLLISAIRVFRFVPSSWAMAEQQAAGFWPAWLDLIFTRIFSGEEDDFKTPDFASRPASFHFSVRRR